MLLKIFGNTVDHIYEKLFTFKKILKDTQPEVNIILGKYATRF